MTTASKSKFISFVSDIAAEHFPETLGPTYITRTPWIFPKVFGIVKNILDKDTVSKFRVHSDIPTQALLDLVPKEQLLKEFGGENEDVMKYPVGRSTMEA